MNWGRGLARGGTSIAGRSALPGLLAASIIACGAVAPSHAQTPDRWVVEEAEANAVLPAARGEARVSRAVLSCVAQRWTLRLDLAEGVEGADGGGALVVDGNSFDLTVESEGRTLTMAVPRRAIGSLKAGLRMEIELSDALRETIGDIAYPLRGSRLAIDAAQERCSPRDMSAYRAVTLTPYSSYLNLARTLREDDIAAFATSTASQPKLDVAMIEGDDGRRLFFTRLCGSSWYYGATGCNITGFAPDDGEAGWRQVYDTENVVLYTDPGSATEGWPDIVTLPARGDDKGRIWRWTGMSYAFDRELPDEAEAPPLGLRGASD
ncbi:hypothetical protein [Mesorhizobium sp. CAU 1732]|uniref:hypothetical protein n=1 Tax=Mesorhizobium sp. CAU 1732 TaxID=3140358 RepID=UPI00326076F7